MTIKKHIPANRKSFRARHNCDEPGPKWMEKLMLNTEDKAKILHGNAERIQNL